MSLSDCVAPEKMGKAGSRTSDRGLRRIGEGNASQLNIEIESALLWVRTVSDWGMLFLIWVVSLHISEFSQ